MTTIAKIACRLADLPQLLPKSILWMASVEYKRGPCVVVSNDVTKRFVQFYGGFGRPIVFDVPVGGEGANTPFRSALEKAFGAPKNKLDDLEFFQQSFAGWHSSEGEIANAAARVATATLVDVLGIPKEADVLIEEILAGMEIHSRHAVS